MKQVKLFGSKDCPLCSQLKLCYQKLKDKFKDKIEYYDTDTKEGLAESAFWEVVKLPTIIIISDDEVLQRWEAEIPPIEDIEKKLQA